MYIFQGGKFPKTMIWLYKLRRKSSETEHENLSMFYLYSWSSRSPRWAAPKTEIKKAKIHEKIPQIHI